MDKEITTRIDTLTPRELLADCIISLSLSPHDLARFDRHAGMRRLDPDKFGPRYQSASEWMCAIAPVAPVRLG